MREIFTGCNGKKLALHVWDEVETPTAVVQFIHGMHDNMAYYDTFAAAMNARGIIVVGLDCPMCGESADIGDGGVIGDYFGDLVKDNITLLDALETRYRLPIFLIGMGSGSLVVERCIQIASEHMAGAIIIGAVVNSRRRINRMAACMKLGKKIDAIKIDKIFLKKYNRRFKKEKIPYAWLSADEKYTERIGKEPQNNVARPVEYFLSFYNAMSTCLNDNNISTIRKSLPLLLLSGEQDAMGDFGKKVLKLYDIYVNAAMTNVKMRLFQNSRHALLHGNAKNEATRHIGEFIEEHCCNKDNN